MLNRIAEFNFWQGNVPKTGLLRKVYLDRINSLSNNELIKVLVGQRRSGKSYILRQIIAKKIEEGIAPTQILYVNMEFTVFDFIEKYQDLELLFNAFRTEIAQAGKVYLFLDEIQNVSHWEIFVNSLSQDFNQECEIFITGSNSKMLSNELATLLSGRYVSFEIMPFSYQEFLESQQLENLRQNFIKYMQTGGFPEFVNLPNDEAKTHYVSALKDTVLLRDIVQRYKIKDVQLLEDIFVFLVNNASNLISITLIVNYFKSKNRKTNYETVSSYLHYLEDAFLVHKAERFNIKGKEIISGNCKYYINDVAFRNYLYKGFGYGAGYLLENVLYLALRRAGYQIYVGNIHQKEVDFVALKDGKIRYVQSSYLLLDAETIEREFSVLSYISDNYEKFVVTLDDIAFPSQNGIDHLQAWDFIVNKL